MSNKKEVIHGLEAVRDPLAQYREMLELLTEGEKVKASELAVGQAKRDHQLSTRETALADSSTD